VTTEIRARDAADIARSAAPMVAAPDAMLIDTTEMDADAAFAEVIRLIETKQAV
jgi:cytidylate kinase